MWEEILIENQKLIQSDGKLTKSLKDPKKKSRKESGLSKEVLWALRNLYLWLIEESKLKVLVIILR